MVLPAIRPVEVQVFWKYRLNAIQEIRHGLTLNKPFQDSDIDIAGVQNEGLLDVPFDPAAEKIDLYYRPVNEAGRGPAINIVPTGRTYTLHQPLPDDGGVAQLRGSFTEAPLATGTILRSNDEMFYVTSVTRTPLSTLLDGLLEFWSLKESAGAKREGVRLYDLDDLRDIDVLQGLGPITGDHAATFDGTNTKALYHPYHDNFSVADIDDTGMTVAAWIRVLDATRTGYVVSKYAESTRREYGLLYDSSASRMTFKVADNTGAVRNVHVPVGANVNNWMFAVGRYHHPASDVGRRELQLTVYRLSGTQIGNATLALGGAPQPTSVPLVIGARLQDDVDNPMVPTIAQALNGRVADVGVWKRPLSFAEVAELRAARNFPEYDGVSVQVGIEDRCAHGTMPTTHAVGDVVEVMKSTVATNSIVMDALLDRVVPGPPQSLVVSDSEDDAEIGFVADILPPLTGTKTLRHLRVQASTRLWAADIRDTLGVNSVLTGPHTGTIAQGGRTLVADTDFAANTPYFLYTYESINTTTGEIVFPRVYEIASISGRTITITNEKQFVISRGVPGARRTVSFVIARGWQNYVVDDTQDVNPPQGDVRTDELFRRFYKTTQDVYVRTQYDNGDGAGQWLYWDGTDGDVDRNKAIKYEPPGLPEVEPPDRTVISPGGSEFIYRLTANKIAPPRPTTTIEQDETPFHVPDDWSADPPTPTREMPFGWISVRQVLAVGTERFGKFSSPAPWISYVRDADDRTPDPPSMDVDADGLNARGFYQFLVGVEPSTRVAEASYGQVEVHIARNPGTFTPTEDEAWDSGIIARLTVPWTHAAPWLTSDYGIYSFSARMQNRYTRQWSIWSNPIREQTIQGTPEDGVPSAPGVTLSRMTGSDLLNIVIRRPLTNFRSIWGYLIQIDDSPLPNTEPFVTQLRGTPRVKGTCTIDGGGLVVTRLTAEGDTDWAVDEWVGHIIYLHTGITVGTGEVGFPLAYRIASNTPTTITVDGAPFRTPPGMGSPATMNYIISQYTTGAWLRSGVDLLHRETLEIEEDHAEGPASSVPDEISFTVTAPLGAYVRVGAGGYYGRSPWGHAQERMSLEDPDPPRNLHLDKIGDGDTTYEVDWEPPLNAPQNIAYQHRESTDPDNFPDWSTRPLTTSTVYIKSNAVRGTRYYHQVRSTVLVSGRRRYSTVVQISHEVPAAAGDVGLVGSLRGTRESWETGDRARIRFSWTHATNAERYLWYIGAANGAAIAAGATGLPVSGTSIAVILPQGDTRVIGVEGVNADGVRGARVLLRYTVPKRVVDPPPQPPPTVTAPNTPGSFRAVQNCPVFGSAVPRSGTLNVSWGGVSDADGYEVRGRRSPAEGSYSGWFTLPGSGNTSFSVTEPDIGQTYQYQLRSYKVVSGSRVYSGITSASTRIRNCNA